MAPEDLAAMLRSCLTELTESVASYRQTHGFKPLEGSPAAREQQFESTFAFEGAWGSRPVTSVLSMAGMLLQACDDYADSAGRLIEDPASLYGIVAVARGHLEAATRAWYLLDPDIDMRVRIERGVNERLHGLHQQKKYPAALGGRDHAAERTSELLSAARHFGFKVSTPEKRAPSVGHPRPDMTSTADKMLGVPELGSTLYRLFSGIVHAQPGDMFRHGVIDGTSTKVQGVEVAMVGLQPANALQIVAGIVLGSSAAFERYAHSFGWDETAWRGMRAQSMNKIKDAMNYFDNAEVS